MRIRGLRRYRPGPGRPRPPSRALIAVPVVLIGLIALVDLVTSSDIQLAPLLVAAPAISASVGGPALAAGIGALAVAVQTALTSMHGGLGATGQQAQLAGLVVVSVFVVVFCYARDRRERELTRARSVAETAQRALLRPLPPRVGPLLIASVYVAAEAEAQIGGDLYAAVRVGNGTRVMIGDVRGKGLTGVGNAALLMGAFRAAAHRGLPLPGLVAHLDRAVHWNTTVPEDGVREDGESFITAALVDIPDDGPLISLVTCGHPPPLLLRDGAATALDVAAPALPLGLGLPYHESFPAETFRFEPGGSLLLYTDGVIEARDRHGAFYPLAERAAAWYEADPPTLVRRVHDDLLAHAGGHLDDDVAMIAIRRLE
ncbi:PP2C family protein-serine/threonine phosphatase [Streptomyces sp. B1866]|uniref:PP2C family protein-serine/threonine phosphatase n=1 Tax=Streptomyces sp. B1866 TaxID=3075431 RepID=UPI00288E69CC|nr:PP2C family protein-serine/threonine phosphatase [Streptomyces sp. B1866]MDT3398593.1 PP2C family protein-serine/threonine phosphatase [Streptomyces sp. B1866]